MSLLERLNELRSKTKDWDLDADSQYFLLLDKTYPKLLAVVEAAKCVARSDNFFMGADSYGQLLINDLDKALTTLEKEDV